MKLKHLLFTALCLLMGANAWAQATLLYERGTAANPWSTDDLADWTTQWNTLTIDAGSLYSKIKNAGWTSTKTIAATKNAKVTFTATLWGGQAPGRSGSYDYIKVGGVSLRLNGQDKVASVDIDGTSTNLSGFTRGGACTITCTIDQAKGDVTWSVTGTSSGKGTGKTNTAVSNAVFGHNRAGSEGYEVVTYLQSISVSEEKQTVQTGDYTIKYLCGEEEIKESTSGSGTVNSTVTISKDAIWKDGVKYIYVSDDAADKPITANGVTITVNYRVANTYNYTIVLGNNSSTGSNYEGETIDYPYARYINKEGTLYTAAKQGTNPWWGKSFVLTQDNQVESSVTYTKTDIENVVFFTETEDIEGATKITSSNADIRCSMKAGGYYEGKLVTLAPGKYKISTSVWGNTGETITFKAGETIVLAQETKGSITDATSEEFIITKPTDITISGGNTSKMSDFIYIVKTGDISLTEIHMSITDVHYATFCTPADIEMPEGVEAYTCSEIDADNNLVLVPVEGSTISANTPVILYSESVIEDAKFEVYVEAMGASATSGLLTGVFADTEAPTGSYVLQKSIPTGEVAFHRVNSDVINVPAFRAYLSAPTANAKAINFPSTTAIKAIDSLTSGKAEIYDINGRKLQKLQKGINIVNGVKIMVK